MLASVSKVMISLDFDVLKIDKRCFLSILGCWTKRARAEKNHSALYLFPTCNCSAVVTAKNWTFQRISFDVCLKENNKSVSQLFHSS